jgi:predicted nuclease of predicted toxin-antitoxin system
VSRVKYLFDEDLNGRIVRGVRRRISDLDSTTVQEVDLPEASDPAVLDWAASQDRIVITHDHRTMRTCAEDRLKAGLPMTGLILVRQTAALGQVIDDLVLIAEATTAEEWKGTIVFLRFKTKPYRTRMNDQRGKKAKSPALVSD